MFSFIKPFSESSCNAHGSVVILEETTTIKIEKCWTALNAFVVGLYLQTKQKKNGALMSHFYCTVYFLFSAFLWWCPSIRHYLPIPYTPQMDPVCFLFNWTPIYANPLGSSAWKRTWFILLVALCPSMTYWVKDSHGHRLQKEWTRDIEIRGDLS